MSPGTHTLRELRLLEPDRLTDTLRELSKLDQAVKQRPTVDVVERLVKIRGLKLK